MFAPGKEKEAVLAVAERLSRASIGEVVSKADLQQIIGGDVDRRWWIVATAREILNKQMGVVFATVRKEGLRRLGSVDGVHYLGERSLLRVRSTAKRGQQRLERAAHHANDLSADDRRQLYSRLSSLNLIQHFSLARVVKTLPDEPPKPDGLAELKRALGM